MGVRIWVAKRCDGRVCSGSFKCIVWWGGEIVWEWVVDDRKMSRDCIDAGW